MTDSSKAKSVAFGAGTKRRLSVCMIVSSFYPLVGGAERQAQQLAARLIERGADVCVLTRRHKGLKAQEQIDGIPVYRIPTVGSGMQASLSYTFFSLVWLFRNRQRYPIVHCHQLYSPTTIGAFARLLWGKRVLVKVAGSGTFGDISGVEGLPFRSLRRGLLDQVDIFVVVNDEARSELRRWGVDGSRIRKIPNGVDTDRFAPPSDGLRTTLRKKLGLHWPHVALFVGRLSGAKGLDGLFHAWPKVGKLVTGAHLVLLGEGEEENQLFKLAQTLGIEGDVSFVGRRDDVCEYLQAADLFVLPSVSEGLSNSLLEAMAAGLPVVATKVGGTKEAIISRENGLLVEPGNPGQMAEALQMLFQDVELAAMLGRNARDTVEKRYSLEQVAGEYLRLYESLLD